MPLTDNNYYCSRCEAGHAWESMTSTPEGTLYCPSCWKQLTSEVKRKCPVDGAEMQKRLVADGTLLLDFCAKCEGTWFDKNELQLFMERSRNEELSDWLMLGLLIG